MLRNRDTNAESCALSLKRTRKKSVSPPEVKRKKVDKSRFDYDATMLKCLSSVADFAPHIFEYLHRQETKYRLPRALVESIQEANRAVVFDWLVDCQQDHTFSHETLYMAMRLFDAYMVKNPFTGVEDLQLVAASGFLIASKFEEYRPVSVATLEGLCEGQYDQTRIKGMEREVLRAVDCDLGFPLAYSFLRRYSKVVGTDMHTLTVARFYLELATHYTKWALESPSKLAAASLVLALNKTQFAGDWAPILEQYSGHSADSLARPVRKLNKSVAHFKKTFPGCDAVLAKYADDAFFKVAAEFMA